MKQRIITGSILAAALCVILLLRNYLLVPAMAAASVLCCIELLNAFGAKGIRPVRWLCIGYAALVPLCASLVEPAHLLIYEVLLLFAVLLAHLFRREPNLPETAAALCASAYAAVPLSLMTTFLCVQPSLRGALLIACAFLFAYFGDMAAYFTGVFFGRHKMVPRLSPKKTWEGAAGGLLGSVVVGLLLFAFEQLAGIGRTNLPLWGYLLLGLFCGVAEQAGDLTASLIKRFCGIKDYGNLFPGHGGMMDRMDSVLFTTIVIYGYCLLAELL